MKERKRKKAYSPELAGRMYKFFLTYDGVGAPSFSKFARSIGVSTEDLEGYRKKRNFDARMEACGDLLLAQGANGILNMKEAAENYRALIDYKAVFGKKVLVYA